MKKYLIILSFFSACTKSNVQAPTAPVAMQRVEAASATTSKIIITDMSHFDAANNRLLLLNAMVQDSGSVVSEVHWTHVGADGSRTTFNPEAAQAPTVTLSAVSGEKYVCYAKDVAGKEDSILVVH